MSVYNTYAIDYEFGEKRRVALQLSECLSHAGALRETTVDATSAAKAKLGELDLRLMKAHPSLKTPQVVPLPTTSTIATTTASVPFMITKAMETELVALGYSDADVRTMTPAQAHAILGTPLKPAARDTQAPFTITQDRVAESVKATYELLLEGMEFRNITTRDVHDRRTGLYDKKRLILLPLAKNPKARRSPNFERTDLGNAEYFVELFGHIFRFDRIHSAGSNGAITVGNRTGGRLKPRSTQQDNG